MRATAAAAAAASRAPLASSSQRQQDSELIRAYKAIVQQPPPTIGSGGGGAFVGVALAQRCARGRSASAHSTTSFAQLECLPSRPPSSRLFVFSCPILVVRATAAVFNPSRNAPPCASLLRRRPSLNDCSRDPMRRRRMMRSRRRLLLLLLPLMLLRLVARLVALRPPHDPGEHSQHAQRPLQ